MRPVRLEMEGFASFRTATTVDFDGADYFALVGPTGSGKSTVIDAMVFALFGSAPRWGRLTSVRYALAPTANRATVRLIFDVGSDRYQVAREVRRYGRQIQQKGAALERFRDPYLTTATTDDVQVLASEVSELTPAIEKLLGLSFDEFTKAVVLPQGKFAEFLSATARERQDILLKLLGAHQYDLIMQAAGRREAAAKVAIVTCNARLDELSDATPEAEEAAERRATELSKLQERVSDLDQALSTAKTAVQQRETAVDSHGADVDQLAAVRAPDGLSELQARSAAARDAVRSAREAEEKATQAYDGARTKLEEAGDRTELQLLQNAWTELEQLTETRPQLASDATDAGAKAEEAVAQFKEADSLKAEATGAEFKAKQLLVQAAKTLDDLHQRRQIIAAVQPPPGVQDLAQRLDLASEGTRIAEKAVQGAESADELAQAALADAGDPVEIDRTLGVLTRYEELQAQLTRLSEALELADRSHRAAEAVATQAEAALVEARDLADAAGVRHAAAELRHRLAVGDDCPVCTQVVTQLPAAVDEDEPRLLKQRLRNAEKAHAEALKQLHAAELAADRATADIKVCSAESARLHAALAQSQGDFDPPALRLELTAAGERVRQAAATATATRRALNAARAGRTKAQVAEAALEGERRAAWDELNRARGALAQLGAPVAQAESIQGAWDGLVRWAEAQLSQLDDVQLPTAQAEHERLLGEHGVLADQLAARQVAYDQAAADRDVAMGGAAAASETLQRSNNRIATLTSELASAPTAPEVTERLAILRSCEEAERLARTSQTRAATERANAETAWRRVEGELGGVAEQLRETRDRLVGLGAPPLDMDDLAVAWSTLTDWALQAKKMAQDRLARARADLDASTAEFGAAEQRLLTAAAEHQVSAGSATDVVRAVSVAAELAQERLDTFRADLLRRSSIERDRKNAEERASVAGMLADSLNARKFQRWLAGAALDVLVEAASDSLFELSGKQFSLTHENGEFYVIDHADADAKRSTRTLSGGETFQASLALALALSVELSSISSGAARLDSIFLDEGFGSLDPDSLETVAVTLERLAQGDRMVGVVTHVQGLAERVPTRFRVSRTSRSSTVEREG